MWKRLGRFILKYRVPLLLLLLASSGFMAYHASRVELSYDFSRAIPVNNPKYKTYQRRLDTIYEDKLDGKITPDQYDKLSERYRSEQSGVLATLEQHKKANTNYFELGSKLLKVASEAKNIYLKRTPEEKRQILQFIFSNLSLNGKILSCIYTKPFQLIAERVQNGELWRWRESNPRA